MPWHIWSLTTRFECVSNIFTNLAPAGLFEMLSPFVRDASRLRPVRLLQVLTLAAGLAGASPACVAPPEGAGLQASALDICSSAPEGALCDDKNVCTIFDVCKAGICKGSAAPNGTLCTDGNVCTTADSCRSGTCTGDSVPDATPCTDGDPCTVGDACKTSVCVPGVAPLVCNDSIACTLDVCVAGLGCVFAPVGDCSVPKDAGPDATADAPSDADAAGSDVMMSGGDAASDKADGMASMDTMPPADAPTMETSPPADALKDAVLGGDTAGTDVAADAPVGADGGVDAGVDTQPDATTDADMDAEDDAKTDVVEAGGGDVQPDVAADAPADVTTIPVLRASGGACACATADASGGPGWVLLGLAAATALSRRRRSRP
jgi:MYXO-CTERM domain-containing protein